MPLRIGFDMDGVLADFSTAFHEVEHGLFGAVPETSVAEPEKEEEQQARAAAPAPAADDDAKDDAAPAEGGAQKAAIKPRRRRDVIWKAIQSTPNFWSSLQPIDPGAVRRIHELMLRHGWEVFFITQRPKTQGETVQRQTQRWLVEQGFDLPSVLVLGGSRGAAAGALRLDYHVDDSAQNCLDVIADSKARPILICEAGDKTTIASARKLGIGTAQTIGECLDILEKASVARTQPTVLQKLAALVGWK